MRLNAIVMSPISSLEYTGNLEEIDSDEFLDMFDKLSASTFKSFLYDIAIKNIKNKFIITTITYKSRITGIIATLKEEYLIPKI